MTGQFSVTNLVATFIILEANSIRLLKQMNIRAIKIPNTTLITPTIMLTYLFWINEDSVGIMSRYIPKAKKDIKDAIIRI